MLSSLATTLSCALAGYALSSTGSSLSLVAGVDDAAQAGRVVDETIVRDGLRARLGDEVDTWTIEIEELAGAGVRVDLMRGPETSISKTLELRSDTVEGRSRELASALALIIDGAVDGEDGEGAEGAEGADGDGRDAGDGDTRSSVGASRLRGWLTFGPRVGLGSPARSDYDVGGDLLGGIELIRGHLHPVVLVGWSAAGRADLGVDYMHLGAGLAAGTSVWGERLWVGGAVIPRALWLRASESGRAASSWSGAGDIVGIGHYRRSLGERLALQVSLRVGMEVTLPPLIITGSTATLLRGDVRAHLSGAVGVRW